MKNTWYKMSLNNRKVQLTIMDEIGGWGILAADLKHELENIGEFDELDGIIQSNGGSVVEGMAIYNLIHGLKQKTRAVITGIAASMGSVIAMAFDEVVIHENSYLMVHNPWAGVQGESKDFRSVADRLDEMKDFAVKAYMRHTSLSYDEVAELLDNETWLTGEKAKGVGLASEVLPSFDAVAKFDLSKFKNIPEGAKIFMKSEGETPGEDNQEQSKDADDSNNDGETSGQDNTESNESTQDESTNQETSENTPESDKLNVELKAELIEKQSELEEKNKLIAKHDNSIKSLLEFKQKAEADLKAKDQQIEELNMSIVKRDELIQKAQSEKDKYKSALDGVEAKLNKLTIGGLGFEPEKEHAANWQEALDLCDGDYVQARKQYPEQYSKYMKSKS